MLEKADDLYLAFGRVTLNETERVWSRIKLTARTLAATGRPLTQDRAEELIRRIIRGEQAERPPGDALVYLANELRAFVIQYRQSDSEK